MNEIYNIFKHMEISKLKQKYKNKRGKGENDISIFFELYYDHYILL